MVAFISSFVVVFLMIGGIVWYGRRRPVGKPVTWGEAMVGATLVFFCMFWAYGVVPQAWISFFQNDLEWRTDELLAGPEGTLIKGPISFSKAALGDVITTVIYVFMVGAHISLFSFWGRRGKLQADRALRDALPDAGLPLMSRKGQMT